MKSKILIVLILLSFNLNAQTFLDKSKSFNKKRTIGVSVVNATLWGGSISGLYYVWYKNFDKTNFHTFNDSHEWQQMDKLGHSTTAYHFAKTSSQMYQWAGVNQKKSAIIGGSYAFAYLLSFEMLDAYNKDWGFSWSDVGANTSGALLYSVQDYFWHQQFIKPKFSSHVSGLAHYRPNVLGDGGIESLLKDYNGQTYWLSFNPITMINKESKVPKWINLSVGYGINNQLIGNGDTFVTIQNNQQLSFTPYRQYYLSLDVDWEQIQTQSKLLKLLFKGLNIVKLPLPAIEFSEKGIKAHALYF